MEEKKTEVLDTSEETKIMDPITFDTTGEIPVAEEGKEPKNKKPIIIAIVAVVAVILIGIGIGVALNNSTSTQPDNSESSSIVDEGDVEFNINADGWTEDSSAFIAHVEGKDSDDNEVDFYHAFNKSDNMKLNLDNGTYKVSFISAINSNGSIYKTEESTDIEVKDAIGKVEQTFEKIDADKVSADDLNNLLDKINEAISKGDDTLTGDKGKQEVEKAANNAANNNNADKSKVEEKKSEAASKAESTQPTTTKPAQSSNNGSQNTNSGAQQPTQSNTGSGSNGGNNGNSGSQSTTHQHTPVTVPAKYEAQTVITGYNHHDAVARGIIVCIDCGARDVNNEHLENHILNGGNGQYRVESVEVSPAYDEPIYGTQQVLIEEGYTYCSACGQRL